jgi:hypothetical protein
MATALLIPRFAASVAAPLGPVAAIAAAGITTGVVYALNPDFREDVSGLFSRVLKSEDGHRNDGHLGEYHDEQNRLDEMEGALIDPEMENGSDVVKAAKDIAGPDSAADSLAGLITDSAESVVENLKDTLANPEIPNKIKDDVILTAERANVLAKNGIRSLKQNDKLSDQEASPFLKRISDASLRMQRGLNRFRDQR